MPRPQYTKTETAMKTPLSLCALALAVLAGPTQAACPTWPAAERFELHGDQVIDRRSGLVWQRCSAGQTWDGSTCTGTAGSHSHAEALGLARQANPGNNPSGWRLPNVKELASLLDLGCSGPALDATVFPVTPSAGTWSSTPDVRRSNVAWQVDFGPGHVSNLSGIGNLLAVRLVRSAR